MKATITINMNNAAFEPVNGDELARYCALCGNNRINVPDRTDDPLAPVCPHCRDALTKMPQAWAHLLEARNRYRECCSGISSDVGFEGRGGEGFGPRTHLHFHSESFDSCYPADAKDGAVQTCVEAGVNFYSDRAECYWIFDTDNYCDSFTFGEPIAYTDPEFWGKLEATLDQGAETAWNTNVLSCPHCGYHYNAGIETCCEDEEGEDADS